MDDIQVHGLDIAARKIDRAAHRIAVQPFQFHARKAQDPLFRIVDRFRALMVRYNKDGVAELFESPLERHDARHHTIDIRKI